MPQVSGQFKFSSEAGHQLARDILTPLLPYEPHSYQIEGVCEVLDGLDLLAIIPTGAGKTGYFSMYMLILITISKDPNICSPKKHVPADPAMVIIYPTNSLEEEQVSELLSVIRAEN